MLSRKILDFVSFQGFLKKESRLQLNIMEGLHNRKKEKVNEEDQVEFLDEEGEMISRSRLELM